MEGSFSLRPAAVDDITKILQIEQRVHLSPWSEENIRTELEKPYSQTLVMTDDETDDTVIGYIVFWLMLEECQILNVAVDLPYRGLGMAKLMVRSALKLAEKKGIKKISLEVRKGNQAAIQLYHSVGFSITHVRKAFYSNGEDAYAMVLSLQDEAFQF